MYFCKTCKREIEEIEIIMSDDFDMPVHWVCDSLIENCSEELKEELKNG